MSEPDGGPVRGTRAMIARMAPRLDPETYVFAVARHEGLAARALAMIREAEGVSVILTRAEAGAAGLPADAPMRRITLTVQSALDGVGLTAAVAQALAAREIPCNVVAGFHHDHLFVPEAQADAAMAALGALAAAAQDASDRRP
ncbi:MAG: ACT domain-containing protein [Paracoccaceae bacterium]